MLDGSRLTEDQRDHLAVLRREWRVLAPLLREDTKFGGGMAFKSVSGADYLVRYYTDRESGKKKFISRGRRSRTTERELEDWLAARGRHKAALDAATARVELQCRIAKAHRLARVPVRGAELIRSLWLSGLFDEGLAICGLTSLYAFELAAGELAAPRLLRDEDAHDLELISTNDPERWREPMRIAMREPALQERSVGNAVELSTDDGRRVLIRAWEDFDSETDVMRVLAVARDSKPIEITSVYPDVWLELACERSEQSASHRERSEFVERLLPQLDHLLPEGQDWDHRRAGSFRL